MERARLPRERRRPGRRRAQRDDQRCAPRRGGPRARARLRERGGCFFKQAGDLGAVGRAHLVDWRGAGMSGRPKGVSLQRLRRRRSITSSRASRLGGFTALDPRGNCAWWATHGRHRRRQLRRAKPRKRQTSHPHRTRRGQNRRPGRRPGVRATGASSTASSTAPPRSCGTSASPRR